MLDLKTKQMTRGLPSGTDAYIDTSKKNKAKKNKAKKSKSKDDWWGEMSLESKAQYLADHPNSKKVKEAIKRETANMTDEEKAQHKVALNNLVKNSKEAADEHFGDKFTVDSMKESDPDGFKDMEKDLNEALSQAFEDPKAEGKLKKSKLSPEAKRKIKKLLMRAAVSALMLAGAAMIGIPLDTPILAVNAILLIHDNFHYIEKAVSGMKAGAHHTKEFLAGIREGVTEGLSDSKKVRDAIVPA